jgi:hypothetical protein
MIYAFVLA